MTPGWWWGGGGGGGGWIKWLGPGWSCGGGWEPAGGPCQIPPGLGESTRPGWNPLLTYTTINSNTSNQSKSKTPYRLRSLATSM